MNELQPSQIMPKISIFHRIFSHKVLIVFILTIIISTSCYLYFLFQSDVVPKDIDFKIERGDTIHIVAQRLLTEEVIKHRVFLYFSYYIFGRQTPIEPGVYKLSNIMRVRDIVYTLESKPYSRYVYLPTGLTKEEIANTIADSLDWEVLDRQFFGHTLSGMQWQHYQEYIEEYFKKNYSWTETKTHTFLTLSSLYNDKSYDFLKNMYLSGTYEIPIDSSRAEVAGIILDKFVENNPDDYVALTKFIDKPSANAVAKLVEKEMILMPDIVTIPPQDVTLKKIGGKNYLLFTTSYWNKGKGPLELIADPKTKNTAGDVERNVFQRIYSLDGNYTERLSGKFLWHSPHLHYHFQDFAVYSLKPLDENNVKNSIGQSQKSTFCIRDSEPIDLSHPGAIKSASYNICGRERQGISPGWADSYYYTYVDQRFDVTGFAKGKYSLKIVINPENRFDEITKDNNIGETIIDLDLINNKVKVLEEKNYGI